MEIQLKKHLLYNIGATAALALFGAVYELFSHQVYSYFMIYAFGIPLVLGVLPYAVLLLREKYPSKLFLNLWNTAIAALSIGCTFNGVLAIYGTTNALVIVYPIAGGLLLLIGLASLLFRQQGGQQREERYDPAA